MDPSFVNFQYAEKAIGRSKSSLFLLEQLFVIAIFAICAVICARIFIESHIIASASADLNNALIVAKSGAESFKAASGDMAFTATLLDKPSGYYNITDNEVRVYFDSGWRPSGAENALYILRITLLPGEGTGLESDLIFSMVSVERLGDGALAGNIVEFTAVSRSQ